MSSKIKVDTIENVAGSGNVSLGSGHNLVVPGDLTVDTNTLFVDASADKVGINNTTPGSYLTSDLVVGDATGDNAITVVSGNANASGIFFQDTTGTSIVSGVRYQHDINKMGLWTNGSERLSINADGHVVKPNQPFVRLQLTSHLNSGASNVSFPGNQVTGFTVRENVGNYWNSSNNNFTCPVAGVYQVSVFFIKYPTSGAAHVDLHKNGSTVDEVRWRAPEAGNYYYQAGGTASVTCAANDVLDWHYFGTAGLHNGNGSWEIKLSH